jgi:hypothetical protein
MQDSTKRSWIAWASSIALALLGTFGLVYLWMFLSTFMWPKLALLIVLLCFVPLYFLALRIENWIKYPGEQ